MGYEPKYQARSQPEGGAHRAWPDMRVDMRIDTWLSVSTLLINRCHPKI